MNILIITPYMPYPLDSGGAQAQFHILDKLRKQMHISMCFIVRPSQSTDYEEIKYKWPDISFYPMFENPEKKNNHTSPYERLLLKIGKSVTRKLNRRKESAKFNGDVVRHHSTLFKGMQTDIDPAFIKHLSGIMSNHQFDLIQVEFYEYLSLINILPQNAKTIFIHHEPRFIRNQREMALFKEINSYNDYLYNLVKSYEIETLRKYGSVVVLTGTDKQKLLKELPHTAIFDSPALINLPEIEKIAQTPQNRQKLVFIGSGNHFPNHDAIDWYENEIDPVLKSLRLNIKLQVIGKWQKLQIKHYSGISSDIHFTGFVDDLAAPLRQSIMIAPIRIGGGMRMKLLDAVLTQTPFITTSVGVEGLDFRHNEDCLIADTPQDFAIAIKQLTEDPGLQEKLATHALEKLKSIYDPAKLIQRRFDIYQQIYLSNAEKTAN